MFGWVWAGDLVRVVVTTGKKAGNYLGRVAIRASGSFNIQSQPGWYKASITDFAHCSSVQTGMDIRGQ